MKELFNKLSNLFSFGKEHRLANVDAPAPTPEQMPETQESKTEPPKTPEEGIKKAEVVGDKDAKTADTKLVELKAEDPTKAVAQNQEEYQRFAEKHPDVAAGLQTAQELTQNMTNQDAAESQTPAVAQTKGEFEMEPVDVMKEGTKADKAEASLMKKPGMKGLFDAMGSEKMADVFGTGPSKESIAAAMTGKPQPEEERKMEFTEEEVAQMMKEAEGQEQPDEALMAAAHEAGVKAEEESPFEPMDLSDDEEGQVAGVQTRKPKQ